MFSDHLPKMNQGPTRTVLLILAGAAIVCQLVAMVNVVDGQVEKAHLRDLSQASASAARIGCIETSWGAALRDCDRTPSTVSAQIAADQGTAAQSDTGFVTISDRY
jgi:hypothetical protein